jgi:sortase A
MKTEISLKHSVFMAFGIGIICSIAVIFCFLNIDYFIGRTSVANSQALPHVAESQSAALAEKVSLPVKNMGIGLPVRLRIPKIKVDAAFEQVGLTSKGAMDAPKGPAKAGWFNLGARPGEIGSAVVAGHYGWVHNLPAIFDNLYKLKKGDKIYVEDEHGMTITFVVREIRNFDPSADAASVFISSDGKAHLNLITCGGVWDKKAKQFSKRLVVFADKE